MISVSPKLEKHLFPDEIIKSAGTLPQKQSVINFNLIADIGIKINQMERSRNKLKSCFVDVRKWELRAFIALCLS